MKPKKSLGQNFLTSGKAIFEIVKAGEIRKGETVLEIGPGKGALTEELLKSNIKVIAIEKDRDLIPFLEGKFKEEIKNKKLEIIEGDILDLNIKKILNPKDKYKIIANIPYYITGAIIEKFLEEENSPEILVLLMQKEVAERIVARDKKESILSLAVKFFGTPKIVYKVSAGSFFPKPKVDSAVLKIEINKKNKEKEKIKDLYIQIVKKAFAYKRKMMLNNLKKETKDIAWDNIFEKLNINKNTRAEDLDENIFISIAKEIKK